MSLEPGFLCDLASAAVNCGNDDGEGDGGDAHDDDEYCEFTRDLTVGDHGKDVACLQRYLAREGCFDTESDYRSPIADNLGGEQAGGRDAAPEERRRRQQRQQQQLRRSVRLASSGKYDERTRAAVVRWQRANGVSPCAGFFGEISRARYRLRKLRSRQLAGAKVALDVGHGAHPLGYEVGFVHKDYTELELNKEMATELKTVLENHGATVQMFEYPRGYRLPPWLPERGKRASGHDIFISCHHNGHNGGSQGTETLVDVDATERDISLAHSVQSGVVNALRLEDRGVKWQDLGVLGGVTRDVGAAVLVEAYFMDAEPECSRERSRAAGEGVASGIIEYWKQHRRRNYIVRVGYDGEEELKRLVSHAPKAWCLRHKGAEHEGCKEVQAAVTNSFTSAEQLAERLRAAGFRDPSVTVDDV